MFKINDINRAHIQHLYIEDLVNKMSIEEMRETLQYYISKEKSAYSNHDLENEIEIEHPGILSDIYIDKVYHHSPA